MSDVRMLLIKLGTVKLLLTLASVFYLIGYTVIPQNVDGFYVSVFNPMPGGAADDKELNRRAYDDLQNIEAMVEKLNTNIIKTMYNTSSATAQKEYDNINGMTYSMDGTVAEKLKKSDRSLIKYMVESYEVNKEYAMRDGNIIYGVEEIIRAFYSENGVNKEERLRLKLGYVPILKTFRIVDLEIKI
jgi:hypothetical protein